MTAPRDLLELTSDEAAAEARARVGRGAGIAPRLYRQVMREGRFEPEALGLGAAAGARWRAAFALHLPTVTRTVAEAGGLGVPTEKVTLRVRDGHEIESVRIPLGSRRSSQCLSSQVGCRMACRFCETARMGLRRDLSAAEIVAQVVAGRTRLDWRPGSLVFMGMGEPLDNLDNVLQALHVLADRRGLGYAQERITLCTVGRSAGLAKLAALGWKRLGLAFSLSAADDALRRALVPEHRNESLRDLQRALRRCRQRDNLELAIHYCLLPGLNDSPADARAVAAFCAPLGRCMVHVIPYNPGSHPLTRAPTEPELVRFVGWLRQHGLRVRRRITKGRSVMAACGQLRR